jgi:flagellar biosynthesis chaperone FliJ
LLSEETKSKIQKKAHKQNNPRYGVKLDNDLKEKIRESNADYEYCIVELENNITHKTNSLRDFCKRYDLKRANLTRTFTGKYKQHKGFRMVSKVPL